MKKAISLLLVLVLCLSLCACDSGNTPSTSNKDESDTSNTETNQQEEVPNHPLVKDIAGEWKPGNDTAPFNSLSISEDGSCVVDNTPAIWKIEGSYTTDTDLSIRVFLDGKIAFGMIYYSGTDTALLTSALDDSFANSPMYICDCPIERSTENKQP